MLPVPEITTAASYVPQPSHELLRVLVAVSDPDARAALRSTVSAFDDMIVIDDGSAIEALLARSHRIAPDVLLLDQRAAGALRPSSIPTLLVVDENDLNATAALASGARGVIPRTSSSERLHAALRAVSEGLVVIDVEMLGELIGREEGSARPPLAEALTTRESEVLQLLASGLTNKEIATRLGITDHTVKFHVNAILGKLGAETRTEAVVDAVRRGIIVL